MKLANVIKRIEKATGEKFERNGTQYYMKINDFTIDFFENGEGSESVRFITVNNDIFYRTINGVIEAIGCENGPKEVNEKVGMVEDSEVKTEIKSDNINHHDFLYDIEGEIENIELDANKDASKETDEIPKVIYSWSTKKTLNGFIWNVTRLTDMHILNTNGQYGKKITILSGMEPTRARAKTKAVKTIKLIKKEMEKK